MSRGGFKITRVDGSEYETGERVAWLDEFAKKIEAASDQPRNAVEAARARDHRSLVDQISSIMTRRPASTVESKVNELQERTGLKEWLRRNAEDKQLTDTLSQIFPKLSSNDVDDMRNFIKNLIETHHGNIHVPAVIEEVGVTFRRKGVSPEDINVDTFQKYISDQIVAAQKREPFVDDHDVNIGRGVGVSSDGRADSAHSDAFQGLMPVKTNT